MHLVKLSPGNEQLWHLMKSKFDGANGDFRDEFMTAYVVGMRDVAQEDLARLATFSPEEEEGSRLRYSDGENAGAPLDGRSHLVRNILAVWQEPDALTRGKLLVLLGLKSTNLHFGLLEKLAARARRGVLELAATLSTADRAVLRDFIHWCATDAVGRMDDYFYTKEQAEWLASLQKQMETL